MKFKLNDDIEKPFVICKSKAFGVVASILAILTVGFAIIFTIIQPILQPAGATNLGPWGDAATMIFGPVFFGIVAFVLMSKFQSKYPAEYKALSQLSEDEKHHN
jgi:hypothetical protein